MTGPRTGGSTLHSRPHSSGPWTLQHENNQATSEISVWGVRCETPLTRGLLLACLPASLSATSMKELRKVTETASPVGDRTSTTVFMCSLSLNRPADQVCLTFEVEESHSEAALSHCIVEVVRGQMGNGVHVQHVASIFINRRCNFIVHLD